MNIEISDWQLIRELERRIESKDIFRANNGKLWPRFCPACGGTITEYGVNINFSPKEIAALNGNLEQWEKITRDILDKAGWHLPNITYGRTGKLYFVRCDNYGSFCDPCPVVTWNWFSDLDDARLDFFDKAQYER